MRAGGNPVARVGKALASTLDPRNYVHGLKLLHHYNYTHVSQVRLATIGPGARVAPNVSITNGERVQIGARTAIGARCHLWAGNKAGRVIIGEDALFGPEVFLTASNYGVEPGTPPMYQDTIEGDVVIGAGVWLGARVMVMSGVTIGDGAVVGANSVVTRDLPANCIAAGTPARIVGWRGAPPPEALDAASPREESDALH